MNIFGYDIDGLPLEVPWSRAGWSKILDNGMIDCRQGNYAIYRIDGYSVIEVASSDPYDYPDEANKALAKWRNYINGEEVSYEFYIEALEKMGYDFGLGKNTLADIDWEQIE